MSDKNENIEDLEKELLELKKKKLQKQIKDLEDDLDIPVTKTDAMEQIESVITKPKTKKNKDLYLVPIFIVIIAAAVLVFNQDDFELTIGDALPAPDPEFLDIKYISNGSKEYTFNNRTGCIPILEFNLGGHPVLGQPGKTTFEVRIPNFESAFRHSVTNSNKASVVLITSSNFVNGDNLYTDKNFAGQTDLTNNIIISKEGSRKTYEVNPKVPAVIFGLNKTSYEACDYRVNK